MSQSRAKYIGLAAVLLLVSLAAVVVVLVGTRRTQTLSDATSPDGTWRVTVLAEPRFGGSYEIVAQVKDAEGNLAPTGAFVIGMTSDLDSARKTYAVTFDGNEVAHIGDDRVIEKSRFLP